MPHPESQNWPPLHLNLFITFIALRKNGGLPLSGKCLDTLHSMLSIEGHVYSKILI